MINKAYLLEKPAGPPPWKRVLDQEVMPYVINTAAVMETAAELVAVRVRQRPFLGIAVALGLGAMFGLRRPERLRARPRLAAGIGRAAVPRLRSYWRMLT